MSGVGVSELLVISGCCLGVLFPAVFLFSLIMALTRKSRGWVVGAVISGILALLFLVGGVVVAVLAGVKEAKESARPRAFSTSDGIATVMGAARWRDLDIGSEDASLGIGNVALEQYLVVISESRADFPEGYTLAEFAELASDQALANLAEVEAAEFSEVTVGGMPGLRHEVTGKADGLGIFYLNTYLESPGHYHQVMTWTLAENQDRYRSVLEAAADSFREVGGATP